MLLWVDSGEHSLVLVVIRVVVSSSPSILEHIYVSELEIRRHVFFVFLQHAFVCFFNKNVLLFVNFQDPVMIMPWKTQDNENEGRRRAIFFFDTFFVTLFHSDGCFCHLLMIMALNKPQL